MVLDRTPDPELLSIRSDYNVQNGGVRLRGLPQTTDPEVNDSLYRRPLSRQRRSETLNVNRLRAWEGAFQDDPYSLSVQQEHEGSLNRLAPRPAGFYSLKRIDNPNMQVVPTITLPDRPYPSELSTLHMTTPYADEMPPTPPPPTGNVLFMEPEPPTGSKPTLEEILYENEYIGHHRFVYSINRLPALICVVISLWILFGKGEPTNGEKSTGIRTIKEKNEAIVALTTGIFTLLFQLYGLHNHNNSHSLAIFQTYIRVIHTAFKFFLCIALIILSLVAIYEIKNEVGDNPSCASEGKCYSHNERLTYSVVLLGMALMICFLSIISFFYGFVALRKLFTDRQDETKRRKKPQPLQPLRPSHHFRTF